MNCPRCGIEGKVKLRSVVMPTGEPGQVRHCKRCKKDYVAKMEEAK